jgi:hypothetical protein
MTPAFGADHTLYDVASVRFDEVIALVALLAAIGVILVADCRLFVLEG